jgi:sphingolipid delta-4 desaturase
LSIGLHPLGARWIQRHYLTSEGTQETFSYYGPLNRLAFNVGYHNEHHDFPSVPWNRLPQIHATAPEAYDNLASHRSWTSLLFRFLFDRNLTLYSRVVRNERNRRALDDEVNPDVEQIELERGSVQG